MIAKGVRLLCTNTVGKNSKMVVLRTQGSSSMKDNIIIVFGPNTFKCLEPFSVTTSDGCQIEGFLSRVFWKGAITILEDWKYTITIRLIASVPL